MPEVSLPFHLSRCARFVGISFACSIEPRGEARPQIRISLMQLATDKHATESMHQCLWTDSSSFHNRGLAARLNRLTEVRFQSWQAAGLRVPVHMFVFVRERKCICAERQPSCCSE